MTKYFTRLSPKVDGNPEQWGTYSTDRGPLKFDKGIWYAGGFEVTPPDFYFTSIPTMDAEQIYEKHYQSWHKKELSLKEAMLNAITEASLYPKDGFSFNQVAELCAKAYWDGNLNKGNIDPEVWIQNNIPKIPKENEAVAFTKWFKQHYSGSLALGFHMKPNGLTRFTIEELYPIFKQHKP